MIELSFGNIMSDRIGSDHGISDSEFECALNETEPAYRQVQTELRSGKLGFASMLEDSGSVSGALRLRRQWARKMKSVVHIGIGGSALGPMALHTALVRYGRRASPEAFFLDNVDPVENSQVLDRVDVKKTLFHVVTKSGETAETVAVFMIVVDALRRKLGRAWLKHVVVTTDPEKGFLRQFANEQGITSFDVPQGVGGRYSVLSPVGMVPLALCGVDIRKILAGAHKMSAALSESAAGNNPAFVSALIHFLLDRKKSKKICVMMPYSEQLRDVAAWFAQLWAESLGKKLAVDGSTVHAGQMPVAALGTTDQHSLLQLLNEGPNNTMVTLLAVGAPDRDLTIPKSFPEHEATSYLRGVRLGQLLKAERQGTESTLTSHQRPNMTLTLSKVSPESMGALLFLLEMQTVYGGALYRVNPFDQPGVEEGKRVAYGLLGRKGFGSSSRSAAPSEGRYRLTL